MYPRSIHIDNFDYFILQFLGHTSFFQSKRRQKESKLNKKLAFESTIPQALEMVGGSEGNPGCMMDDDTGSRSIKGIKVKPGF